VTGAMSIFGPAFAIAASEPKKECANCHPLGVIIADLRAWSKTCVSLATTGASAPSA
jgi:hypothetical protein